MYFGLMRIPLKWFFSVTGWLIVLLAAGLAGNPKPAERTAVVAPRPTAMELLAGRRARMVDLATSPEDT